MPSLFHHSAAGSSTAWRGNGLRLGFMFRNSEELGSIALYTRELLEHHLEIDWGAMKEVSPEKTARESWMFSSP